MGEETDRRKGGQRETGEGEKEGVGKREREGGGRRQKDSDRDGGKNREADRDIFVVCWLLNVPATCECISGTDLLGQVYLLPH